MAEPLWVDLRLLVDLHAEILELTGGAPGLREEGLLQSALTRPVNRFAYEGVDDLVELAAVYAVGVAKNHPFIDGNKRAAFACMGLFLLDNGLSLEATDEDATLAMRKVAAGEMDIDALAAWLRANVRDLRVHATDPARR